MSKTYGKYNERNIYSMADSPKNEDESRDYANALHSSGYYPAGLNSCFTVGISGGCSQDCWVFQEGKCGEPVEGFVNWEMSDEDILGYYYDNEFYKKEIEEYFKENNKLHLIVNRDL